MNAAGSEVDRSADVGESDARFAFLANFFFSSTLIVCITFYRKSHDHLVALAEKRSEFLVRSQDHSDGETQQRKLASGLRRSFESVDTQQSQETSRAGPIRKASDTPTTEKFSQHRPVSSASTAAKDNVRGSFEVSEARQLPQRASNSGGVRSSREGLDPKLGSPSRVNARQRRPSNDSAHSALSSSTAGLPVSNSIGGGGAGDAPSVSNSTNSLRGPDPADKSLSDIDQRLRQLTSYLEEARY
jgi:hypothetical protein